MANYVAYYRVSTTKQGVSGLGLESQQASVKQHLQQTGGELLGEFSDICSGKRNDRTELMNALKRCRLTGATLLIAKLDRLGRNAKFLMELQESELNFICLDMPEANKLTIGFMASLAEYESDQIGKRVKDSYEARRARGITNFGNPNIYKYSPQDPTKANQVRIEKAAKRRAEIKEVLIDMQREYGDLSLRAMAQKLNEAGFLTPRGKAWSSVGVMRVLAA